MQELFKYSFITILLFGCSSAPDAPITLSKSLENCSGTSEICGDGIDQNCDGIDPDCDSSDIDFDGFASSSDCNDNDNKIYPGVYTSCNDSCQNGTKLCNVDGSYSECNCTPLCEATANGRCFYVSAERGSDNNPGTFDFPWSSFANFVSYDDSSSIPSSYVELKAGDVIYLLSGTYTNTYSYYGEIKSFFINAAHGTHEAPLIIKAYPGEFPVIASNGPARGIGITNSQNIKISGIEVRNSNGAGIYLSDVSNAELNNNWVHDIDGEDNNNLSGIYLVTTQNTRIHHNLIHDNYDRTNADTDGNKTENSRNIVLFRGGNIRIDHNNIFQSPPISAQKTGVCITYKHAADIAGSIFEVDHNRFRNCWHTSIGSGTSGNRFHNNIIIDSGPIEFKDFGGITNNSDTIIEYNTIIRGAALSYLPSDEYNPIGNLSFQHNIILDTGDYNFENGIMTISPYGTNEQYKDIIEGSKLTINNNCYYNPNKTLSWAVFARNGDGYGNIGAELWFSGWKALGFDSNSNIEDPMLDSSYNSGNSQCSNYGWLKN